LRKQPLGEASSEGLNVAGYFRAENGLGEAARLLLAVTERSGIPVRTVGYEETPSRQLHPFDEGHSDQTYDTNIVVVNGDNLASFARSVGREFFVDRYTVAYWAWETDRLPDSYLDALDYVDEVWMPSEYSSEAARSVTAKPVHTFPYPILAPQIDPTITRDRLGLPDGFLFTFMFDYFSTSQRKNPHDLIRAYRNAFREDDGAALFIKTLNAEMRPDERRLVEAEAAGRRDIRVLDGYMTLAEKDAVLANTDCYASLHRSEGFGLGMAEAMALGKPVIGTGYSGNVEFMNEDNSYLIPYSVAPVGKLAGPYTPDAHWAMPDVAAASRIMRHVFEDRADARAKGERARADILARHSPLARVPLLLERLDTIKTRRTELAADLRDRPQFRSAEEVVAERLRRGPQADVATTRAGLYGSLARVSRKLVNRAVRNYHVYQIGVETALLEAIAGVDRRRARDTAEALRRIADLEEEVERLRRELQVRGGVSDPPGDRDPRSASERGAR
jgi:glycosyltransferase involved in cell wall biosynthesis